MVNEFVWYLIVPFKITEIFFQQCKCWCLNAKSLRKVFIVCMKIWKETDLHKATYIFFHMFSVLEVCELKGCLILSSTFIILVPPRLTH